jgi:hypothetical protein
MIAGHSPRTVPVEFDDAVALSEALRSERQNAIAARILAVCYGANSDRRRQGLELPRRSAYDSLMYTYSVPMQLYVDALAVSCANCFGLVALQEVCPRYIHILA